MRFILDYYIISKTTEAAETMINALDKLSDTKRILLFACCFLVIGIVINQIEKINWRK